MTAEQIALKFSGLNLKLYLFVTFVWVHVHVCMYVYMHVHICIASNSIYVEVRGPTVWIVCIKLMLLGCLLNHLTSPQLVIFKTIYIFDFICMCVFCVHAYLCTICVPVPCRNPKRAEDCL